MAIQCCLSFSAFAQGQYRFQLFDKSDGLADNYASYIIQDSLGFIWIQNPGALTRYDGHDFKVYKYDPGDSSRAALDFVLGALYRAFAIFNFRNFRRIYSGAGFFHADLGIFGNGGCGAR